MKQDHVNLPHVSMGGKYRGMEFVRGAKGRATYLGMKKTRLHEEKEPTSFAKSSRRHSESTAKHNALKKRTEKVGHFGKTTPKNEGERRFMGMMKNQKGRVFENKE